MTPDQTTTAAQYCIIHVAGLQLGVDVRRVQEVLGPVAVTPVPLADPSVCGLLNLRGRIVTAVDARTRLGLAPRPPESSVANVVMSAGGETVSLVVDREGEVVEIGDHTLEPVPDTVAPTIKSFTRGCYQLEGALLLILDADRAFDLTTTA